jgi:hypothetical protein
MLERPHIRPLTKYVAELRDRSSLEFPEFDPADGGTEASLLFLYEKPGPMTSSDGRGNRAGSGFISRDNDDPTAEATFRFMHEAGIPRAATVIWNVVPGWNGTRRITSNELADGVEEVRRLIGLLPRAKGVILVGQKAARAEPLLRRTGLRTFRSDHPSPLVRASHPERWLRIPEAWRSAAQVCGVARG